MPSRHKLDIRIYRLPSCVTTKYLSIKGTISTIIFYGVEILYAI